MNRGFRFILLGLMLLLLLSLSGPALAWNNKGTHPAINDWAIRIFEKNLRAGDQLLAATRLDGGECYGIAWDPQDGTANTTQTIAVKRKKTLKQWIIDGGFSADEPEIMQGLRHFYDPKNPATPWLTDTHGVADWLENYVTPERGIPEIDAVTWAIDEGDRGDDGAYGVQEWVSISQDYSWYDARKYFKLALADANRDNENYGKAWRAVGEVMHLMADMAVPAHVRNDGHMWSEPLEGATDRGRVNACAGLTAAGSLNYETGVETLMRALATWANENFLSQDTVSLPSGTATANGKPAYASPLPTATTGTYDYRVVSGQSLKLARRGRAGLIGRLWYGNNGSQLYQVDEAAVLKDQQQILIPTAVRACAAVLKRFLPRLNISAEVSQNPDFADASLYSIHGEVSQTFSGSDWNERLIIKNGVYLVVNGKVEAIPERLAGGDFNEFTHDFSAQEGDEVYLRYDLGGYVVESSKVEIEASSEIDCSRLSLGLTLPGNWKLNNGSRETSTGARRDPVDFSDVISVGVDVNAWIDQPPNTPYAAPYKILQEIDNSGYDVNKQLTIGPFAGYFGEKRGDIYGFYSEGKGLLQCIDNNGDCWLLNLTYILHSGSFYCYFNDFYCQGDSRTELIRQEIDKAIAEAKVILEGVRLNDK